MSDTLIEPIRLLKPEAFNSARTTPVCYFPSSEATRPYVGVCKSALYSTREWRCPEDVKVNALNEIEREFKHATNNCRNKSSRCLLGVQNCLRTKCLPHQRCQLNYGCESSILGLHTSYSRPNCNLLNEHTLPVEDHSPIFRASSEENHYYGDSETDSQSSLSSFEFPSSISSEIHSHINTLTLAERQAFFPKSGAGTSSDAKVSTRKLCSPLSPSLFHNVPPSIHFRSANEENVIPLPVEVRRLLHWKLSPITPIVIRQVVVRSGFRLARKNVEWIGLWGKHMKSLEFKFIKDNQKVNHFPGSHHLGRKDTLLNHLRRSKAMFKDSDFNFLPDTFLLPKELKQLHQCWKLSGIRQPWIVKPPASARGSGIYLIYKWSQVPKKQPSVVQRYIPNPYLINGLKFDLRVYVLVTSFNPLKIYVYQDGLVRFASVKYSSSLRTLSDKFMHLTNYSINKKNSAYVSNEDEHSLEGHKWTLRALWRYLLEKGEDVDSVWDKVIDIIIKTIVSVEGSFNHLINQNVSSNYTCFELFGFDIMLDTNLKPWLLEVNISPSLHAASNLDTSVKSPLVKDMFNIVGYHIPDRLNPAIQKTVLQKFGLLKYTNKLCIDKAYYYPVLTNEEISKQEHFTNGQKKLVSILDELSPDDVRKLMQSEDEFARRGQFKRVFPSSSSHHYLDLMLSDLYYNRLLMAWELQYHNNREEGIRQLQIFAESDYHLKNLSKFSVFKDDCITTEMLADDKPRTEQEILHNLGKLGSICRRATFKTGRTSSKTKRTGIFKTIPWRSLEKTKVSQAAHPTA